MINFCLIKTNNNENILENNYTIENKNLKKIQNFSFKNKSDNYSNHSKENFSGFESSFLNIKHNNKIFKKEYDQIYINANKKFIDNILYLKNNYFVFYERDNFLRLFYDLLNYLKNYENFDNSYINLDISFEKKIYNILKNVNQKKDFKTNFLEEKLKNFEKKINSKNYNVSVKLFSSKKDHNDFNFFCFSNYKKMIKDNNFEIKKILEKKSILNKKIIFIDFLQTSKVESIIIKQIKNLEIKEKLKNIFRDTLKKEKKQNLNFLSKKHSIDSCESINKSLKTKNLSGKKKVFSSIFEKQNCFLNSTHKNFYNNKIGITKIDKIREKEFEQIFEKMKNLKFENELLKEDILKKDSKIKRLEIKNNFIKKEKKINEQNLKNSETKIKNLKNILKNIGVNYSKKLEEKTIEINEFEKKILKIKNSKKKIIKNKNNENNSFIEKISNLEKELETNKMEKTLFLEKSEKSKISKIKEKDRNKECYKIIQKLINKKFCENKKIENLQKKNLKLEKKVSILRNSLKMLKKNFKEVLSKNNIEKKNFENSNYFLNQKNFDLSKKLSYNKELIFNKNQTIKKLHTSLNKTNGNIQFLRNKIIYDLDYEKPKNILRNRSLKPFLFNLSDFD